MGRAFDLDSAAAKESNSGGKRIKDSGKYIGAFKAAWYEKNERGTESVHFLFVSDAGQEAGPLALYTHNGDGDPLPSYKTLHAILACMKVRRIEAKRGKVELYDYNSKAMVTREHDVYPELAGKKVGIVLQREEYENNSGEVKERLILVAPFEAATGLMADEVLARATEPRALANFLRWIEAHPLKELRKKTGSRGAARTTAPAGDSFVDDDIPF